MGNSTSSAEWIATFNNIKINHDKAYHVIEEAISLEEQEKPNEAIDKYKEGINFIDNALKVQVTMPEMADFRWEQACRMIQKMKKTRGEVLTRIQCIQSSPGFIQHEPPPPYDQVTSGGSQSNTSPLYSEISSAAEKLATEMDTNQNNMEVIYSYDNVKLYFISPDGTVCETCRPEKLVIGYIEKGENETPSYYIQVGNWVYPLVPGISLCYRTDYGAFIFPDVESEVLGSSVGVILPKEADPSVYEVLESILHGLIGQTQTLQQIRKNISESISEKIISGAAYLSENLVKGAQKASDYINQKTPELMQKITPAGEPAVIPRKVSRTLEIANTATSKAASVTGFVAEKVSCATLALGQYLAPRIENQGTKILKNGFNMSETDARAKMNSILTVAAGAIEGFSTVYRGLETSASILGKNLSENTVKVVEHKYGAPAGELACNTLGAGGNVYSMYSNSKILTPKGFVKNTGKGLMENKRNSLRQDTNRSNPVTASNIHMVYPNLEGLREMEYSTPTPSVSLKNSFVEDDKNNSTKD